MHASAQPHDGGRGVDLLLYHCAALGAAHEPRQSGYERLVAAVGEELARMLLSALAADRGPRAARLAV